MQVHKFGGASVGSAAALRNVSKLLKTQQSPALIVMSAMGKMTNALEAVVNASHGEKGADAISRALDYFLNFHETVIAELEMQNQPALTADLATLEQELRTAIEQATQLGYHRFYDSIVPFGERYSTTIASHFLQADGNSIELLDARELVRTDDTFREARINWSETNAAIQQWRASATDRYYLVQGFVGSSSASGASTTLGREGSDFTAAIFASAIAASSVTLWKDVAGVYSADPKLFPKAERLNRLSYIEALEMANYGAKVIHPKTLKPLENNGIPLLVKSFQDATLPGTEISKNGQAEYPPVIVKVPDLLLLRLQLKDLSYISDDHLHYLFELFRQMRIKVYMMQTGFITLSAGISIGREKLEQLESQLADQFNCRTTVDLELLTVRHYRAPQLKDLIDGREIFLEQRSMKTVQLLLATRAAN